MKSPFTEFRGTALGQRESFGFYELYVKIAQQYKTAQKEISDVGKQCLSRVKCVHLFVHLCLRCIIRNKKKTTKHISSVISQFSSKPSLKSNHIHAVGLS